MPIDHSLPRPFPATVERFARALGGSEAAYEARYGYDRNLRNLRPDANAWRHFVDLPGSYDSLPPSISLAMNAAVRAALTPGERFTVGLAKTALMVLAMPVGLLLCGLGGEEGTRNFRELTQPIRDDSIALALLSSRRSPQSV